MKFLSQYMKQIHKIDLNLGVKDIAQDRDSTFMACILVMIIPLSIHRAAALSANQTTAIKNKGHVTRNAQETRTTSVEVGSGQTAHSFTSFSLPSTPPWVSSGTT